MNALWLTRMCAYKHTPEALESAKQLIGMKIERESALLARYGDEPFVADFSTAKTISDVLITEAHAARHFWRAFRSLLPAGWEFHAREPHAHDPVNKLLDVGYHRITGIVRSYLLERDVPASLGLLHVARRSTSEPLAYDLVELFRADTVDAELLRFVRLKKKPLTSVDSEIAHFLHELHERLNRRYYLRDFKQCHTYHYYMQVQMLKFIHAINHQDMFSPIKLPDRHESRCSCLTPHEEMLK